MKIDSKDSTIQQILQAGFYQVPRFQRPYRWDSDNVTEFWQDTVLGTESDYFIGSMVVFKVREDLLGIVDGQQRLTTITMIFCALRNIFRREGFPDLADGLQSLIERADINNKAQYVLQTETSYPYLQEHIQKDGQADVDPPIKIEEANLRSAFAIINTYLDEQIATIKTGVAPDKKKAKQAIEIFLKSVRDKLLSLKVIFVNLDNEDDAYLIFETLNTRGKDLGLSDLVKGLITRLAKPNNANVDIVKDKWGLIVRLIEESEAALDVSTFIHHYWLSMYEYLAMKKLYRSIKKTVKTSQEAKSLLGALVKDAPTYRAINEVTYRKWSKQEYEIRQSLEALILFRVKQPLPMVLSIMREYREGRLKKKNVKDILQAIEHFHFVFTAVTSQRSSGGISQMYASHARQLVAAHKPEEKLKALNDLKQKLRAKKPTFSEFEAAFQEIRYSEIYPKQKKLVQYILAKHHRYSLPGTPVNYDQMTIEHLAAQNLTGPAKVSAERCAELGNLILLDHELNGKLGNKPFAEKLKIFKKSKFQLENSISTSKSWGEAEIAKRTKALTDSAYKKIWTL